MAQDQEEEKEKEEEDEEEKKEKEDRNLQRIYKRLQIVLDLQIHFRTIHSHFCISSLYSLKPFFIIHFLYGNQYCKQYSFSIYNITVGERLKCDARPTLYPALCRKGTRKSEEEEENYNLEQEEEEEEENQNYNIYNCMERKIKYV